MIQEKLGLYIHIPFCRSICQYCDFAKSANFQQDHISQYFSVIEEHLQTLMRTLSPEQFHQRVETVFFGGGTPGLFTEEYTGVLNLLERYCPHIQEVTLEVNPEDISVEALKVWKGLGVNRLSMGVQTLHKKGLTTMTRRHSPTCIYAALDKVPLYFDNFNVDLIYGWPGQKMDDWQYDIQHILQYPLSHLSLYNLIYEPGTPFGKKLSRGVFSDLNDNLLADMYEYARTSLAEQTWTHDEVSNWSRPGGSCLHNWLYWQNQSFLGIGCGAFGLWNIDNRLGFRYWFPKDFRQFLRHSFSGTCENLDDFLRKNGAAIEVRSEENWLMEYIGGALRSRMGVNLAAIREKIGKSFVPNTLIRMGLEQQLLQCKDANITLAPQEWFRENQWALELILSFE